MAATESNSPQPKKYGTIIIKLVIVAILIATVGLLYLFFGDQLTLENLGQREGELRQLFAHNPVVVFAAAFLLYSLVTGLSLPGATVMSLVYGWFFGFVSGVILVSFASTTGATLAFLLSRYLFRDAIQRRFGDRIRAFNEALDREGAFYLFTLRLIPAMPFFVINVVMGLTNMRVRTYWWVSQVGMLAGTCVYLYAGSTIPSIEQISDRSQLQAADVLNWPRLFSVLQSSDSPDPQIARIRELLADDELNNETKEAMVLALNRILKRHDFALKPPLRDMNLEPKEITMRNRKLLEASFEGIIRSPKPILSWQLFAAFVLLGIFPLLVKRTVAWVRPSTKSQQTPEL